MGLRHLYFCWEICENKQDWVLGNLYGWGIGIKEHMRGLGIGTVNTSEVWYHGIHGLGMDWVNL